MCKTKLFGKARAQVWEHLGIRAPPHPSARFASVGTVVARPELPDCALACRLVTKVRKNPVLVQFIIFTKGLGPKLMICVSLLHVVSQFATNAAIVLCCLV